MDATRKTEDEVCTALHDCDNDPDRAVNMLLEGMGQVQTLYFLEVEPRGKAFAVPITFRAVEESSYFYAYGRSYPDIFSVGVYT